MAIINNCSLSCSSKEHFNCYMIWILESPRKEQVIPKYNNHHPKDPCIYTDPAKPYSLNPTWVT